MSSHLSIVEYNLRLFAVFLNYDLLDYDFGSITFQVS